MKNEKNNITGEVTCYEFHKIVNARLESEGILNQKGAIKRIPPQMIYNYTIARVREGKVPFIPIQSNGLIKLEDGLVWLEKYISKKKLGN